MPAVADISLVIDITAVAAATVVTGITDLKAA
jgi:hypothetical protein